MEINEGEVIESKLKNACISYEKTFCLIKMNYCLHIIKKSREITELQRKKIGFINRLKYAQHKILCIYIDLYKLYEVNDFIQFFDVLSRIRDRKLRIKIEVTEKNKNIDEKFGQSHYYRTAIGIYKIGHNSSRLEKWIAYYHRYYPNMICFDLMTSILKYSNDLSS